MTVDVDPPPPSDPNLEIDEGIIKLLELFRKYKLKSTFFVTATMAEKFPDLMRRIVRDQHEIACHDLDHSPQALSLNAADQTRRVKVATKVIEAYTNVRPIGYRAPLFKISRNHLIALQRNGYIYDSSMVCSPFLNLRRISFSSKPFLISISQNGYLIEIPIPVNPVLLLPMGGAYIRVFGTKWAKIGIKWNFLFKFPVVFHIHPKDVVYRKNGPSWYSYKNTAIGCKFVEEIILYAKKKEANFVKAIDLVNIFLGETTAKI